MANFKNPERISAFLLTAIVGAVLLFLLWRGESILLIWNKKYLLDQEGVAIQPRKIDIDPSLAPTVHVPYGQLDDEFLDRQCKLDVNEEKHYWRIDCRNLCISFSPAQRVEPSDRFLSPQFDDVKYVLDLKPRSVWTLILIEKSQLQRYFHQLELKATVTNGVLQGYWFSTEETKGFVLRESSTSWKIHLWGDGGNIKQSIAILFKQELPHQFPYVVRLLENYKLTSTEWVDTGRSLKQLSNSDQ